MPTKSLQFEGRNLGSLLEQVREEVGVGARIIKAERVRRGGFAGFFTREHFEVTVEIDLPDETAAADRAPAHGTNGAGSTNGAGTNGAADNGAADNGMPPPPAGASAAAVAAVAARAFLADQTKDVVDLSTPVPSTETANFASVLAGVANETVARGAAFHERHEADRYHGAEAVERLHEVHEAEAEVVHDGELEDLLEAQGEVDGTASAHEVHDVEFEDVSDVPPPAEHAASGIPASVNGDARVTGLPGSAGAAPGGVTPAGVPAPLAVVTPRIATAMSAAGIPASLMPDPSLLACIDRLSDGEDDPGYLALALARMFDKLPAPPPVPIRHGSLLVIAGELERARGLAILLATEAGLNPAEQPVAAETKPRFRVPPHLLIQTAAEAAELVPGWRRGPRITVLALGVSWGKSSRTWARYMVEALRPTAVWGVATATQKPEDIAAWAHDIGEIDALALEDLADTVSPAAAVAAGIPVIRLDGVPATPALWSTILVGRLTAERQLGQLTWC